MPARKRHVEVQLVELDQVQTELQDQELQDQELNIAIALQLEQDQHQDQLRGQHQDLARDQHQDLVRDHLLRDHLLQAEAEDLVEAEVAVGDEVEDNNKVII